jgi:hypothetical protein
MMFGSGEANKANWVLEENDYGFTCTSYTKIDDMVII